MIQFVHAVSFVVQCVYNSGCQQGRAATAVYSNTRGRSPMDKQLMGYPSTVEEQRY